MCIGDLFAIGQSRCFERAVTSHNIVTDLLYGCRGTGGYQLDHRPTGS